MHVVAHVPQRIHGRVSNKRMYSPRERGLVRYDMGLGEVDGLFNIGKMFSRLTTFTPGSFQLKNIMGALGSATAFTLTGGLSTLAPKVTGAHSGAMKALGYGTAAVAAVAGGVALLPAGSLASIGGAVGTGLKTVASVMPVAGKVLGGSGGGGQIPQQQQGGMTQAEYDAQVRAYQQQQQAAYEAEQLRQQQIQQAQAQMYVPAGYGTGSMAYAQPASMNTSYGDLRSPYTAITEDGQQVQVDPATGQVIQPGMSTEMIVGIAALALVGGIYFMSGNEKTN